MKRQLTAFALVGSFMFGSSNLAAQQRSPTRPLAGESPTIGVRLHAPAVGGNGDASAVEINPGALGMIRSWNAMILHSEILDDGRIQGRGDAVWGAHHYLLPLD